MRVLIFALLAITASAKNYGYNYGHYGSAYPSYGYGSSLYGSSYGSGIGYGSGLGYGSGITYGVGGGHGHYTTARQSGGQQYGTGVYRSGYTSGAAPGQISFTLGGTGYQTGVGAVSGYGNVKSSAVSNPYGIYPQGVTSIHRSGALGSTGGVAPGKISFTQHFSKGSGQISGIHKSSGIGGISAGRRTVSPVTVVKDEYSTTSVDNTGSLVDSGIYDAGEVSGINYQEVDGIGDQGVVSDVVDGGVKRISAPVSPSVPRRPYADRTIYRSGTRTTGHIQPHISFTQDFSKVGGHSGTVVNKPQIQSFNRITSPVRPHAVPKITSGSYGQSGIIRSSGFLGSTGAQPQIRFSQDFSKVRGHSQQFDFKPRIHNLNKVSSPVAEISRVSAPVVGNVEQHQIVHDVDYLQKTGAHGITGVSEHGSIGTHGSSGVSGHSGFQREHVKPVSVSSFDKISTGSVATLPRQSSGNRFGSTLRTSQIVSGAGPAKISFTQDFSRVSGHTSGIKPVVLVRNEVPAFPSTLTSPVVPKPVVLVRNEVPTFPSTLTSPVAPKPVIKPIADKLVFKSPKQPVVQQPTFTTVYDQSPVQRVSGGAVEGYITEDKSPFAVQPVTNDFIREQGYSYKERISNLGNYKGEKLSDVAYAPLSGAVHDKSNMYVAVPVDTKSELTHSAGVIPASGYAEEKESVYEITSGLTSHAGQGQVGYSAIAPSRGHYSSSYPGYSHVSGESPRFGFSHDKSLLYTYGSPYISSPLSYSSGK